MLRILSAILLCSILVSAGFLLCVLLGVPGFADEREGWIGIPRQMGYAVGTRSGNMVLGGILYAIYGGVFGIVVVAPALLIRARRRRRRQAGGKLCPVCGDDLRARPGACPECGA